MKKVFWILGILVGLGIFGVCLPTSRVSAEELPTAVGNCGGFGGNSAVNWSYISGPAVYWSTLEPQRGQFVFDKPPTNPSTGQPYIDCGTKQPLKTLKQIVDSVPQGQKIWLQVVTDTGACPKYARCDGQPWPESTTIPQWAIDAGVPSLYNPESRGACGNTPSQWDPKYRELLGGLLAAVAKEYDNNPKVEAYLMMSGGLWGEMALPYHEYGSCATAINNPDNVWVKEMARIYSKTPDELRRPCNGFSFCFDYYYTESIKKLVDIYARTFKKPVVLQLGGGTTCKTGEIVYAVADYATNTYGNRVWLKQNGWGNQTSDTYFSVFDRYRARTRTIEEIGNPGEWCAKAAPTPGAVPFGQCGQLTQAEAISHNNRMIDMAIKSGVSAVCFYNNILSNQSKFPVDFGKLRDGLIKNYYELYLKTTVPLIPTIGQGTGGGGGGGVTVTPTPRPISGGGGPSGDVWQGQGSGGSTPVLVNSGFKSGWNILTLENDWVRNLNFNNLPDDCPYVVYRKNDWFYSFARGYKEPENFVPGREYSVFCQKAVVW